MGAHFKFFNTMIQRLFLILSTSVVFFWSSAAAARPNIVMILIDDMGWGDFSCFGNKDANTPNIDRLASEGIRFSQFYVNAPLCSPSRCRLTTGQYRKGTVDLVGKLGFDVSALQAHFPHRLEIEVLILVIHRPIGQFE